MCNCFYSFKSEIQIIFLKTKLEKSTYTKSSIALQTLSKKLLPVLKDKYYE
jgi:hypothetical protein